MPVFHTRTIESILDPVAQQVSRLVILHEEAEDGNPMPDLEKPVSAVSQAVKNLVSVGRETIHSSNDEILKADMPSALIRVESASKLLEEASTMLKQDPLSQAARKKLIDGSRGILQGTSSLLLCFDESEVRKIIRECKKVMEYLAVAEVVDSLEDLVRFVQDLSPCLSKVSHEIDGRQKELTHQVHRDILLRCMEEVKNLTPILICSMKIYIQIHDEGGKGREEATLNRDYLVQRMTDEINEIIRVLQLTTYDEDEWDSDNITVLKRAFTAIDGLWQPALDWLRDPQAIRFGAGEKSTRRIIEEATKMAERVLPTNADSAHIKKLCSDLTSMINGVCELRQSGQGSSPQAESLAKGIEAKMNELRNTLWNSMTNVEKMAKVQPAYTVSGRLQQANKWLESPTSPDDSGLGQRAIRLMVEEGQKVAECLPHGQRQRAELNQLTDEVQELLSELLHARSARDFATSKEISTKLQYKLAQLRDAIHQAVLSRVVEDFMDTVTPVKEFTRVVTNPDPNMSVVEHEHEFAEKAAILGRFSSRIARTAKMVSAGGCGDQKKLSEVLLASAYQLESLTPQLVNAGRIRMGNPAAGEHFENLRREYEFCLNKVRVYCDEAVSASQFIAESEAAIKNETAACEESILRGESKRMVDHTSKIARLANRVLMVLKQEADNSEDIEFIQNVSSTAEELQRTIPAMVYSAKDVALNPDNDEAVAKWRSANSKLVASVGAIGAYLRGTSGQAHFLPQDFNHAMQLGGGHPHHQHEHEHAPERPPLPDFYIQPPRPPPPEDTDDEETGDMFTYSPLPNQPIMAAAHGLHQEVKQWSSKDNEIVASAKRMALLMARLSQLVRGEGGTKKELIACAKDIADASDEVTKLAKELAADCTDKRMRTNLLQVCERIPTIGTQLKILSTVKATMLGAQGTEEDREATEMLVGNAQNLMQSVKETVRAAEAASIKIRTDAGLRLKWVRKQVWYKS